MASGRRPLEYVGITALALPVALAATVGVLMAVGQVRIYREVVIGR